VGGGPGHNRGEIRTGIRPATGRSAAGDEIMESEPNVLRLFVEFFLTLFPTTFFLQGLQVFGDLITAILGIFGIQFRVAGL